MIAADVLDLTNWKLTLPIDTDHAGSPDEIRQPELATYDNPDLFTVTDKGVTFTASVDGAVTANTTYPRCELREMFGPDEAAWSATSGTHVMTLTGSVDVLPPVKGQVCIAQIKTAAATPLMQVVADRRAAGIRLAVRFNDVWQTPLLANPYTLGTPFILKLKVASGRVKVCFNGTQVLNLPTTDRDLYFKAGNYTLANLSTDQPGSYGRTSISTLTVKHS